MLKKILKVVLFLILAIVFFLMTLYRPDLTPDYIEGKYETPESIFLDIDGQKVHLRLVGEGEPVFLIHGSFSSLHTWDVWQKEMSPYFLTISIDLPGHGLTGPSEEKRYSVKDYSILIQKITDKLDLESFHLAGNSMGGAVAMQVASDNPSMVRSLNLVNSASAPRKAVEPRKLENGEEPKRDEIFIFKLARNPVFSKLLLKCTPKFLFKMNMEQVYFDQEKISEEVLDRYYELMLREGNRQATLDRLLGARGADIDFEKLRMPTLITWGKHDNWIPLSNGRALEETIPGSKLKVFENAGHVPMEEIPTESVAEYLAFLGVEVRNDYFSGPQLISSNE